REVLAAHGLILREVAGTLVIARDERRNAMAPPTHQTRETDTAIARTPPLETVAVSASRYETTREPSASRDQLDRQAIQMMPDLGEDPVRIVHRLPGAASGGLSARAYVRGGDADEVGILLNGKPLFDPYHIRDYQSLFSAIDARAIDGVEVYTGAFPAPYGNRLSGMVLLDSLKPDGERHSEVGLSIYNTSLLSYSGDADGHWLASVRRGNLDLVIDPKFGSPKYFDVFGETAWTLSETSSISLNALYANDDVRIVLEADPEELEEVTSATENLQLWVTLDTAWTENLSSRTVVSGTWFDNQRIGALNDSEHTVASVDDSREVREIALRQDFRWRASSIRWLQWGVSVVDTRADYDYRHAAQYFGLQALFDGFADARTRAVRTNPSGASYSLYLTDRWRLPRDWTL
ncbi:MAG: TonB-dependent receptor plug domain-containing protein, partial [Pseudomonadota bacterium]